MTFMFRLIDNKEREKYVVSWLPVDCDTLLDAIATAQKVMRNCGDIIETMIFTHVYEDSEYVVFSPQCRWFSSLSSYDNIDFSADVYGTFNLILGKPEFDEFYNKKEDLEYAGLLDLDD